jgi:hypothetical protein
MPPSPDGPGDSGEWHWHDDNAIDAPTATLDEEALLALLRTSLQDAAGGQIDLGTILDAVMDEFDGGNSTGNTDDATIDDAIDDFLKAVDDRSTRLDDDSSVPTAAPTGDTDDSLTGEAALVIGLPRMRIDSVEPFFGQEDTTVPFPTYAHPLLVNVLASLMCLMLLKHACSPLTTLFVLLPDNGQGLSVEVRCKSDGRRSVDFLLAEPDRGRRQGMDRVQSAGTGL